MSAQLSLDFDTLWIVPNHWSNTYHLMLGTLLSHPRTWMPEEQPIWFESIPESFDFAIAHGRIPIIHPDCCFCLLPQARTAA